MSPSVYEKKQPLLFVAFLLAIVAAVGSSARAQLGTVSHNGVELAVRDAAAVWNPDLPRLVIYLFPFELTSEEIERCRRDDASFIRREPATTWPNDSRAFYALNWWSPEGAGDPRKAAIEVYAYQIVRQGHSAQGSARAGIGGVEQAVEGKLEVGAEIHLKARGEQQLNDTELVGWNLDLRAEILSTLE